MTHDRLSSIKRGDIYIMPNPTFFNIPDEKREKLIQAIKDEFARVSFDEVSINKIIQNAEIPRGSFYQYFNGKNDMLEFILMDYMKRMFHHIKDYLINNNGNIFDMFYEILDFSISFTKEEKDYAFYKNLFADMKVNTEFYLKMPKPAMNPNEAAMLKLFINTDMLNLQDEDDFNNMVCILIVVCRQATVETFMNMDESETIKLKYRKKLELLKRGFEKQGEISNA